MRYRHRSRLRNLLTLAIFAFVLWQVWQKVHIVFWVHIPWWGLILLVLGTVVVVDLLLDWLLGRP